MSDLEQGKLNGAFRAVALRGAGLAVEWDGTEDKCIRVSGTTS